MGDYEIRVSWANFGKQATYQGGDKMQLLGRYPADVGHISARASIAKITFVPNLFNGICAPLQALLGWFSMAPLKQDVTVSSLERTSGGGLGCGSTFTIQLPLTA